MIQENKWSSGIMCIGQLPNESLHSWLQGGSACALLVAKSNYYIFDPHSRDRNSRVVESGASVLLHFTTVRQCSSYIQEISDPLNCNYYEIATIDVNHLLLERYVTDQIKKQAEKNKVNVHDHTSSYTDKQQKVSKREREKLR